MKKLLLFIGLLFGWTAGALIGQTGSALDFDGANDYVDVPSSTSLNSYGTSNEVTIEYWVKPDPVLAYAFEPMITKRFTSNTSGILINKATAGGVHSHWLRFTTGWQRIDVPYTVGAWNHVAVTYQSGSGMRVYLNGSLAGSNPINGTLVVNTAPLQLGGETAGSGFKYNGQLDEFRFWNRALSASEINADKDCEISGGPGLVAYYQFNQGLAYGANPGVTSLPDLSGSGNNGTLQNFALNGATSNWIAPGGVPCSVAPGAALDFDGNDNVVNIPSTSILESYGTTNEITIEYWVNPDPTLNYVATPAQPQAFEPIVSKRFTSNTAGILIDKLTAGGIHTHWLRFTTGWQRIDVPYPTGTWSHVALTYQSGSGMNVYVNGVLVGSNPINGSLVVNNAPLQIGGETVVYNYKYRGQIDEFRMWSRALSVGELNANKDCELAGPAPGLLAYYQFNEGIAFGANPGVTSLPDLSGNNHNGTLQNFNLNGPNSNWVAPGGVTTGTVCNNLSVAGQATDEGCPGANDGAIDITPAGGSSPYSYAWSNGATTEDVSNLPAGSYSVTVSDANTLTATASFTINPGVDNIAPVINCGQPAVVSNSLTNPSFENGSVHNQFGVQSWNTYGSAFSLDQNVIGNAQDGNFFMKTFGGNSGLFQDIPLQAGDQVTATIYIQNASFDPMNQVGGGQLKLEWIGVPGVETSPVVTALSQAAMNAWEQVTINTVAPAGATGVRFVAACVQPVGGAVMFDGASLVINGGGGLAGNISVDNDPGQCGAALTPAVPQTSDNCGVVSVINDFTGTNDATGFYPIGTTTVTWTVTDGANLSSSCSVTVTVTDTEAPTISCNSSQPAPNLLVNNSFENGTVHNQFGAQNWVTYGSAFAVDQNVIGSAQDGNFFMKTFGGNSGLFQDLVVQAGDNITASVYIQNASFDPMNQVGGGQLKLEWIGVPGVETSPVITALGPQDVWQLTTITTVAPPGATGVRFVAACVQPVGGAVMFDNASLVVNGVSNIVVDNDPGQCGAAVAYTNSSSDNCPGAVISQTSGLASGSLFPVGTTTNSFTVTDASGNTATCSFDVTVSDVEAPALTCPADIQLSECVETASWTATVTDNCPGAVTVVSNPASGSSFALGSTTTVSVTATDGNNNTSNCTFTVTRDPDLSVSIDPVALSSVNTCAGGGNANIVLGYGGGSTCVTLNATANGGDGNYTYSWTAPSAVPASAFTGSGTATPTFCADFQSTACVTYMFQVTVTDAQGCTETEMVAVNVVNVNVYANGNPCGNGKNPKVIVCHVPPGNSSNAHSICVSANAVSSHINNHGGDCLGDCDAVCETLMPGGSSKSVESGSQPEGLNADLMTIENFPNPFDRMTTVRFGAISDTQVSLVVFDLNGQEVQVLFDGAVTRGQKYETTFDGSDLPSGIYFYRLTTKDGDQLTGKMSLIK